MNKEYKTGAVIVAAGSGLRFGEKKQFKKLGSKPLYLYSLQRFIDSDLIDEIVLVVPKDLIKTITLELGKFNQTPKIRIVSGGRLRQDSVLTGIRELSDNCKTVCIHDAARPFVSVDLINKTINTCMQNDGAVAAMPSNDTVKEVNIGIGQIKRTLPRENIWLAQTPQAFHRKQLLKALLHAGENKIQVTDESTLMEAPGRSIVVVKGDSENIKITTQDDWKLAELILEQNND
ncbi:MAG: 2-C-methyl-D-erythritol 4-phosphate cytidylyltransferase [Candidatus Neomarinimicrobiota bacterium]